MAWVVGVCGICDVVIVMFPSCIAVNAELLVLDGGILFEVGCNCEPWSSSSSSGRRTKVYVGMMIRRIEVEFNGRMSGLIRVYPSFIKFIPQPSASFPRIIY